MTRKAVVGYLNEEWDIGDSPILYSQITGNTESRIPRSPPPLSNILLLLKWSDNKSTQGEKCSSYLSLVDL